MGSPITHLQTQSARSDGAALQFGVYCKRDAVGKAQCLDNFMYELCVAVNDVRHVCMHEIFGVLCVVWCRSRLSGPTLDHAFIWPAMSGCGATLISNFFGCACSELGGLQFSSCN